MMKRKAKPQIDAAWKKLHEAKPEKRVPAFTELVEKINTSVQSKEIAYMEAGYSVCGAIFFDELEAVPELEEAISLACQLELPAHVRNLDNDEATTWRKIVDLTQDIALNQRSGITPRIRLTAVRRDDAGRITATMGGWVAMRIGKLRVEFGDQAIRERIEEIAEDLPHNDDDRAQLTKFADNLDGFGFNGFTLTAEVVEHRRGDGHSEFHSDKAFCGSAGPHELQHIEELVSVLSDEELAQLVERCGIRFSDPMTVLREDLESVIDEAAREDFYREYARILQARKKSQ